MSTIKDYLIKNARPFVEITRFSDKPGIYALFFYGQNFPLPNYKPRDGEIIYIGKTEDSQQKRDANTHFASGKTGSSTVRKSFGSLLRQSLSLKPIYRSQSDIDNRRTSHFKFDEESEVKLTKWMKSNLGLSYYEFPGNAEELDRIETELIKEVVPVINISKNLSNPYLEYLKNARSDTAQLAYAKVKKEVKNTFSSQVDVQGVSLNSIHKYEDIWRAALPAIRARLSNPLASIIQLKKEYFDCVGNRSSYSFNLEFINGRVANGISGTAVARDLARVILGDSECKNHLDKKHIKIRMDRSFTIHITTLNTEL